MKPACMAGRALQSSLLRASFQRGVKKDSRTRVEVSRKAPITAAGRNVSADEHTIVKGHGKRCTFSRFEPGRIRSDGICLRSYFFTEVTVLRLLAPTVTGLPSKEMTKRLSRAHCQVVCNMSRIGLSFFLSIVVYL